MGFNSAFKGLTFLMGASGAVLKSHSDKAVAFLDYCKQEMSIYNEQRPS